MPQQEKPETPQFEDLINKRDEQIRQLLEDNHRWQNDYELLRIQKGGFGFKALLGVGTLSVFFGIFLGWLIFRQKDPNEILFDQFNKSVGFKIEYSVAQGNYADAEKQIIEFHANNVFKPIRSELDLLLRIVKAAQSAAQRPPNETPAQK